jgi:hypothetical protein
MAERLPSFGESPYFNILVPWLRLEHNADGTHDDITTPSVTTTGGTVGAPAFTASGSANTGLYFPALHQVGLATDGVQAFRITDAGVVLVGNAAGAIDSTRGHMELILPVGTSSSGSIVTRNLSSVGAGIGSSLSFYSNAFTQPSVNELQQALVNVVWGSATGKDVVWSNAIRLDDATLTGTLNTNGTTTVTGVGTQFQAELRANVGDQIVINYVPGSGSGTQTVTITNIASNTSVTISPAANQTVTGATAVIVSNVRAAVTYAGVGTLGTAQRQIGVAIGNSANQGSPAGRPQVPLHIFTNIGDIGIRLERMADTAARWDIGISTAGDLQIFNPSIGIFQRINNSTGAIKLNETGTGGLQLGTPAGGDKGAGTINASGAYWANGVAGVATFGPGAVTSITVKNGIVTAIS